MATLEGVNFLVLYNGTDISEDISDSVISISYKDHVKGKSDEIELKLEDIQGKWANEWFPDKKAIINLKIGAEGQLFDCGNFEIDEVELEGAPDTCTIRGISTAVSKDMRTKKSKAREGKTLQQIAKEIADAHNLTLDIGTHVETRSNGIGADLDKLNSIISKLEDAETLETIYEKANVMSEIVPDVAALSKDLKQKDYEQDFRILRKGFSFVSANLNNDGIRAWVNKLNETKARLELIGNKVTSKTVANNLHSIVITRTTQRNESDLAYLTRIAEEYGFAFSIKGTTMVFYNIYDLENTQHSLTIYKSDLTHYSFKSSIAGTYKTAKTKYNDPSENELIEGESEIEPVANEDGSEESPDTSEDSLEIKTKAENSEQAQAKSKAGLHKHNSKCNTSTFSMPINIYCVAGCNVKINDIGKNSGVYHIESSTHKIEKGSGGITDCEAKRVVPPTKAATTKKAEGETEDMAYYKPVDYIGQGVVFSGIPFAAGK